MNDFQNLSHPEIEFHPTFLAGFPASSHPRETLLDLLEVYPDQVKLKPKLNHSSLINYFRVSIVPFGRLGSDSIYKEQDATEQNNPQPLRVLYVMLVL